MAHLFPKAESYLAVRHDEFIRGHRYLCIRDPVAIAYPTYEYSFWSTTGLYLWLGII
jgi:hypothetical protein